MQDYLLILVIAAVVLASRCAGRKYFKWRTRWHDYPEERQWPGHGMDISPIADRVRKVRSDYVSELPGRVRLRRFKDALAAVRRVIGCLPYFRKRTRSNSS
jgi:hypothetical protein